MYYLQVEIKFTRGVLVETSIKLRKVVENSITIEVLKEAYFKVLQTSPSDNFLRIPQITLENYLAPWAEYS